MVIKNQLWEKELDGQICTVAFTHSDERFPVLWLNLMSKPFWDNLLPIYWLEFNR